MTSTVTALVLAGGGSTRFGADKLDQPLGGTTVLGHLLDDLPADWPVVVVGPPRPVARDVRWAREEHPDGGPLAGVEAGLGLVETDLVVVVGGDMPFAGRVAARLAAALRTESGDQDGTAAVTAGGPDDRVQPLLTAYVTARVREVLPERTHGGRARALLEALPHLVLDVTADELLDVDTPEQLVSARRRLEP